MFERFWPADLHLIGKDIVRFHAVYWPALLKSAGLPLPKQDFRPRLPAPPRARRCRRALGNVVDPIELADRFGVDALRYFLLREVSFGQDGSYSAEAIVTRCNAELANSFGNLAQRTLSMIFKNMDGVLARSTRRLRPMQTLAATSAQTASMRRCALSSSKLAFSDGLEAWMRAVFACNQYVDEQAPWALRKTDPERMAAVLMTLLRCVRDLAIAIRPVVPISADRLLDQLGIAAGASAISLRSTMPAGSPRWPKAVSGSTSRSACSPASNCPREDAA